MVVQSPRRELAITWWLKNGTDRRLIIASRNTGYNKEDRKGTACNLPDRRDIHVLFPPVKPG